MLPECHSLTPTKKVGRIRGRGHHGGRVGRNSKPMEISGFEPSYFPIISERLVLARNAAITTVAPAACMAPMNAREDWPVV